MSITLGYKALTHDLRPPVQGGEPLFDGNLPCTLPEVALDTSGHECAGGWNYCLTPADCVRIAGLWSNGRPVRLFTVQASDDAIQRGNKCRASGLTILAEPPGLVQTAVRSLADAWFVPEHRAVMVQEQLLWHHALGRPEHDPAAVEAGLREALTARRLAWELRWFETAGAAWDAWDARAAWAAWAAWDTRDAWDASDASDAWAARDARTARTARTAWDSRTAWDARTVWTTWAAWDALLTQYAARMGWLDCDPDRHTVGIRDAYRCGLAIALPTGPNTLGWAMDAPKEAFR